MNFALALLSTALLVVIQPGPQVTWFAPVALTPLLVACAREPRWKRRALFGWIAGIAYWWGVCYWIQFVLEVHGGMGFALSWVAFVLFALLKAIHLGVFAALAGLLMHRWYAIPAIAALWAGLERTHGPAGFAWLTLGNAGSDMDLVLRLAPFTGVYGLSFVFALTAAALAAAIIGRPRLELAWLVLLGGLWLLPALPSPHTGTDHAVLMQPNLDEEETWTDEKAHAMHQRLVLKSLEQAIDPAQAAPRLIVWPESPGPFYYSNDATFRKLATDLARTARASFLFGAVTFLGHDRPLNSAVMLKADGEFAGRYDKMYLVPFGEFVPPLFSWVNRITKEAGDFTPGENVVLFPLAGHKLGAFICYESAFPHLVRQFVRGGADVLANISNDGYFGRSAALRQHLELVRMRAAENRRWILRATNDGITAVTDPAGRVTARFEPAQELAGRVSYGYVQETTFYTRYGDWFAWGSLATALALIAAKLLR